MTSKNLNYVKTSMVRKTELFYYMSYKPANQILYSVVSITKFGLQDLIRTCCKCFRSVINTFTYFVCLGPLALGRK